MIRLPIKPLTNNRAWKITSKGKGVYMYKSAEYIIFGKQVKEYLSNYSELNLPEKSRLKFTATYGVSASMDLDNCVKAFMDILEEYYGFNDVRVDEIHITKERVKKGAEFIEFELKTLQEEEVPIKDTPPMYFAIEFDESNHYEIIGAVVKILRDTGNPDISEEFFNLMVEATYDELIDVVPSYVKGRIQFYKGKKPEGV